MIVLFACIACFNAFACGLCLENKDYGLAALNAGCALWNIVMVVQYA